jgi:hypothetical protein
MARQRSIKITLTDQELARLDEMRPSATTRPAFLRSLLRQPPREDEVATRTEALAIHTAQARDGKVASAIALERALRNEGAGDGDVLDEILGKP